LIRDQTSVQEILPEVVKPKIHPATQHFNK